MNDDPYRPPGAEIQPTPNPLHFPAGRFTIALLAPLMTGALLILSLDFFEGVIALYPIASLICATLCTRWVVLSRGGAQGCSSVFIWFGFAAFYAIAFFAGCAIILYVAH